MKTEAFAWVNKAGKCEVSGAMFAETKSLQIDSQELQTFFSKGSRKHALQWPFSMMTPKKV